MLRGGSRWKGILSLDSHRIHPPLYLASPRPKMSTTFDFPLDLDHEGHLIIVHDPLYSLIPFWGSFAHSAPPQVQVAPSTQSQGEASQASRPKNYDWFGYFPSPPPAYATLVPEAISTPPVDTVALSDGEDKDATEKIAPPPPVYLNPNLTLLSTPESYTSSLAPDLSTFSPFSEPCTFSSGESSDSETSEERATSSDFSSADGESDEEYLPRAASRRGPTRKGSSRTSPTIRIPSRPSTSSSSRPSYSPYPKSSPRSSTRCASTPSAPGPSSLPDPQTSRGARMAQISTPYVPLNNYLLNGLECPHCMLPFERKGDLERHYDAHFYEDKAFCCNGVAIERAAEFGLLHELDNAREFMGKIRVGTFCCKRFARKDSLLRHIRNSTSCVSDQVSSRCK